MSIAVSLIFLPLLTVSPEGSLFIVSDREVYYKGDDAMLACTHQGGPGNTLQWLKDGKLLQNATNTILTLTSVGIGEIYTCFVSNLAGEDSTNITLNIAPVITSHPNNTHALVNESVVLCCFADAYPAPEYTWIKINGSLPVSAVATENCLIISEVNFGDEGDYICMAISNNITATSNPATVTSECFHVQATLLRNKHTHFHHTLVSPDDSMFHHWKLSTSA